MFFFQKEKHTAVALDIFSVFPFATVFDLEDAYYKLAMALLGRAITLLRQLKNFEIPTDFTVGGVPASSQIIW